MRRPVAAVRGNCSSTCYSGPECGDTCATRPASVPRPTAAVCDGPDDEVRVLADGLNMRDVSAGFGRGSSGRIVVALIQQQMLFFLWSFDDDGVQHVFRTARVMPVGRSGHHRERATLTFDEETRLRPVLAQSVGFGPTSASPKKGPSPASHPRPATSTRRHATHRSVRPESPRSEAVRLRLPTAGTSDGPSNRRRTARGACSTDIPSASKR